MKYTLYFICGLIIYPLGIFCSQQKNNEQPSQFTFNVTVQNQNDNKNSVATTTQTTIENSLPITAKPKPMAPYKRCRNYFGKELKDCMSCLSDEDYYKALCKMNNRQREHYLDQLPHDALKKLKNNCPSPAWESLQVLDPAATSKIDTTIQAYDDQGKDSAWSVLGCTLVCIIAGIGAAG